MSLSALLPMIRYRIVGHKRLPANSLKPHPLNPRLHGADQRRVLCGLLEKIGFARSVLAYVADDDRPLGQEAPFTLLDGHLRREELGAQEVDVEILDVTDEEAKILLLSVDPLARLAHHDETLLSRLRGLVDEDSPEIAELWAALEANQAQVQADLDTLQEFPQETPQEIPPEVYYVLITCRNEEEQRSLLERFQAEGLECRAKVS